MKKSQWTTIVVSYAIPVEFELIRIWRQRPIIRLGARRSITSTSDRGRRTREGKGRGAKAPALALAGKPNAMRDGFVSKGLSGSLAPDRRDECQQVLAVVRSRRVGSAVHLHLYLDEPGGPARREGRSQHRRSASPALRRCGRGATWPPVPGRGLAGAVVDPRR